MIPVIQIVRSKTILIIILRLSELCLSELISIAQFLQYPIFIIEKFHLPRENTTTSLFILTQCAYRRMKRQTSI